MWNIYVENVRVYIRVEWDNRGKSLVWYMLYRKFFEEEGEVISILFDG